MMRKVKRRGTMPLLAVMGLVSLLGTAPPAASQQLSVGHAAHVNRITLLVEDMNRSLDFYQRLGLSKVWERASQDTDVGGVVESSDYPLTADPKVGRLVILKGSSESAGAIGLLSYDKPPLPSARGNLAALGTGDVVIMIDVPDIQLAYSRLSQIGTRFQRTPFRFTGPDGDGNPITGQRMLAFDPDGHLIDVVQVQK